MTITASGGSATISAPRRAIILAILATGSALLSNFVGYDMEIGRLFGYPVLPGLYFGAVIAIGASLWATRSAPAVLFILFATVAAWVIAFQIAIWVNLGLAEIFKTGTGLPAGTRALLIMAVSGLCGGLVGGLLVCAIVSPACGDFRSRANWMRTIIIGGVAGLLLVCFDDNKGWAPVSLPSHLQVLPLFLVWQTAVAASVGYGLVRR